MISLRIWLLGALLLTASGLATAADARRALRICADPDNLPFSNDRLEGFENKIAQVIADDLRASLQYAWLPQSRASLGQTLNAGKCDLVIGAPADWSPVLTTKPYYASTYVFIYLKSKRASLSSFDDPALRTLKIGLPVIGSGGANPPPAYALARRGLASNVIGFPMFPPGKIVEAVASGEIDVAVVWGPFGGYFAKRQRASLAVTPVAAGDDVPSLRFTFAISLGVRRGDTVFKDELERVLEHQHREIGKILEDYGVPVIVPTGSALMAAKLMQ